MSDDTRPYYYRLRGRTLGPFDLRQIRQKAIQAQIGPGTPVSRDGIDWQTMADFPEISMSDGPGPGPVDPVENESDESKWYYAVGGTQQGPVPLSTLQQYVADGMLKADDVVIREGSDTWIPIKRVPELYPLIKTGDEFHPNEAATVPPSETNGLAIAGFVLSLVGCGPVGMILSLIALNSKNKENRGLAIAGAVIGGISTVSCLCVGIFWVVGALISMR